MQQVGIDATSSNTCHVDIISLHSLFRNIGQSVFLKKVNFFFVKVNIFYILNHFDVLILKIIFFKKNYFNIFQHEKYFEK